ncbi:MAG TPA: SDR family oxidoreductase [Steroidobacteraceae bacterium]|jgi:NAD(P)-dependent dehydrogenase (short-subunit alcohol dehydrogenase family)
MTRSKLAVVTGAAQGLGLRTSALLARRGFRLLLLDQQDCARALAELRADGATADARVGDVASESFAEAVASWVAANGRAADVLVNNAGISLIRPAELTTAADWRRVLDVNLLGPFLLSRALGVQMLARRSGSIVNVASVAGLAGISHRSAYNASKHGLIGLTRTLAAEWGGRGVRVNAVCPGWIKTEMNTKDQGSGAYSDADIGNRVPMARFARPEEVAEAIGFLADGERSAFVNGVSLPVDGGWIADGSWESLRLQTRD